MSTPSAIGWAVVECEKINLRTVSDTRRAAIVNFLVCERNSMIYSDMTDEQIERLWFQLHGNAEVEYVTISPHAPDPKTERSR